MVLFVPLRGGHVQANDGHVQANDGVSLRVSDNANMKKQQYVNLEGILKVLLQ